MRRHMVWIRCAAVVSFLLLPLTGCKKANQYAPPPPQKVSVAKPVGKQITRYLEATGNTVAVNSVDLVARVEGFLQAISYTDGAAVKAGDVLFTIEPLPYQAKLQQAQAAEASAQAQLVDAQASFNRQERADLQSAVRLGGGEARRSRRREGLLDVPMSSGPGRSLYPV